MRASTSGSRDLPPPASARSATPMPSSAGHRRSKRAGVQASSAAADRLRSDANQASAGFLRLSAVTSAAQYNQVVASPGLEALLKRFDTDYQALGTTLGVH